MQVQANQEAYMTVTTLQAETAGGDGIRAVARASATTGWFGAGVNLLFAECSRKTGAADTISVGKAIGTTVTYLNEIDMGTDLVAPYTFGVQVIDDTIYCIIINGDSNTYSTSSTGANAVAGPGYIGVDEDASASGAVMDDFGGGALVLAGDVVVTIRRS